MLLWQICLFMLLATRVEGKELNKKWKGFKTMRNIGRESISQNNSKAKMQAAPINQHQLLKESNITVVPRLVATEMGSVVGAMAWQTLAQHVPGCHFVLVTSNTHNPLVSHIIRYSAMASQPLVVVDVNRLQQTTSEQQLMTLWGGTTTTCRAVFLDLTTDDITPLFGFLETSRMWVWSEAWVVLVGRRSMAQEALLHQVLRNVLQPIYLGLQDVTLQDLSPQSLTLKQNTRQNNQKLVETKTDTGKKSIREKAVTVFSRCLYCNEGEPQVRFLSFWPLGSKMPRHFNPFPDQLDNLQGHLLRAVSFTRFPYMDYQLDTDEPATTVTLLDSLDKRYLETYSVHLNFTYEVRAPWDMQFGLPTKSGNWTGMIGTIQHNKADFCTYFSPNPGRLAIVTPVRAYDTDVFAIVSLKPEVLPRYLVIMRPFTVDVWLYLLLVIMIWGISLWLLQRVWSYFSGQKGMTLNTSIFYSWAVILEDPPQDPPTNITGQMMVGWWLVASLVISTGYRASLVTYLVKESRTTPIDSMQDMVERVNWKWCMEKSYLTGYPIYYFRATKDPLVKLIYNHLMPVTSTEGLSRVLNGGYSYIDTAKSVSVEIASYYTNSFGETPYYISKHGLAMFPDFSWGFRKGAPYRNRINLLMIRLQEAGITEYWTKDVMASRVKKNRKEAQQKDSEQKIQVQQMSDDDQVVLRMSHMMGVFFTLLIGLGVAFFIFLAERVMHKRNSVYDS